MGETLQLEVPAIEKTEPEYFRPMTLSNAEFAAIALSLDGFHGLFYQFWKLGKPFFTNAIPTAAVAWDKQGGYTNFLFNPKFWNALNHRQRIFVIAHECLHVILNHGARTMHSPSREIANIAVDLVVNHMLVNKFAFERDDAPYEVMREMILEEKPELLEKLNDPEYKNLGSPCWIDVIFPDEVVPTNQTFEYYYNKLMKNVTHVNMSVVLLINGHEGLGDGGEFSEAIIKALNEKLTVEEKQALKDIVKKHYQENKEDDKDDKDEEEVRPRQAGSEPGGGWTFANVKKVVRKKKWETVIQKWSRSMAYTDMVTEQWARLSRRFHDLPNDIIIPSEMEDEDKEPNRILVYFFQDTSGSCSGFKDRFFTAALSMPPERFDVKMHCFDTAVYETDLKSKKLYGFGGTTFTCIEQYIQAEIAKDNRPYPKAVFVITDGAGDNVRPQYPKNWYVFLSDDYRECFPKECNMFLLSDFE